MTNVTEMVSSKDDLLLSLTIDADDPLFVNDVGLSTLGASVVTSSSTVGPTKPPPDDGGPNSIGIGGEVGTDAGGIGTLTTGIPSSAK